MPWCGASARNVQPVASRSQRHAERERSSITLASQRQFAGAERLERDSELVKLPNVTAVSATKVAQGQATYFMLAGDRARCVAATRTGLEIVQRSGVRIWNDTFLVNSLCSALGEVDLTDAAGWLKTIEQQAPGTRRFDLFLHAYARAWYAMLRGEQYVALQHLRTAARTATELGAPFFEVIGGLALTQVLQASGSEPAADRELARTLEVSARLKNRLLDFLAYLCQATLALSRGREQEALEPLRLGFAIARERGITHWLWWEPRLAGELARVAFAAGVEVVPRHLVQRRQLLPDPPPLVAGAPWVLAPAPGRINGKQRRNPAGEKVRATSGAVGGAGRLRRGAR